MDPQTLAMFAAAGVALEPVLETQIAKVPQQYRVYVPIAIAAAASGAHAYATSGSWQVAAANAIALAAGSIAKHDAAPAASAPVPTSASTVPPIGGDNHG